MSTSPFNPLVPLTASEIHAATKLIKQQYLPNQALHFKVITLEEPAKKEVLAYFSAQKQGKSLPAVERKAFVCYYIRDSVHNSPFQLR